MQKFKTLDDAVELAFFAHRHQVDRAGLPYFKHPKRVLKTVQAQGALPYVQMAAVLHDVTEDTAFTCDMLAALGFPEGAVEIVRLVDREASYRRFLKENEGRDIGGYHKKGNSTHAWFMALGPDGEDEFYYRNIKANPGALMVKLADINDNLQEWRLTYLPQETQIRLRQKSAKARHLLGVWVNGITNNPNHPLHKDYDPRKHVTKVEIDPSEVVSLPLDN